MGLFHYKWSRIAANNAVADTNVNFQEGQAPSSVNDSARALMASAAGFRDDISGAIVTGGTSTAYTVTSFQVFDSLANMSGQMIAFTPHLTNGATVTLNVDGLGAKALRSAPGVELPAGVIIQGTPYTALYNNSDSAWYLQNFFVNPYSIPISAGMDYWGTNTPNSAFAFPIGQAISRTTYSVLFGLMGTTYGVGDGSTTFNLPDKTGRVSAMKEASASRLTSTYFGGNSTNMGAVGGTDSKTLVTANLPPYTPSGSNGASNFTLYYRNGLGGSVGQSVDLIENASINGVNQSRVFTAPAQTFTGAAQGGTSNPVSAVQPTIVCNYIIRVI